MIAFGHVTESWRKAYTAYSPLFSIQCELNKRDNVLLFKVKIQPVCMSETEIKLCGVQIIKKGLLWQHRYPISSRDPNSSLVQIELLSRGHLHKKTGIYLESQTGTQKPLWQTRLMTLHNSHHRPVFRAQVNGAPWGHRTQLCSWTNGRSPVSKKLQLREDRRTDRWMR